MSVWLAAANSCCSLCCALTEQLIRAEWLAHALHPNLYPLYQAEWTKSLSNKANAGVGINHPCENFNQRVNKKGKGVQDFMYLSDVSIALNACEPVEGHINEWCHHHHHHHSTHTHTHTHTHTPLPILTFAWQVWFLK